METSYENLKGNARTVANLLAIMESCQQDSELKELLAAMITEQLQSIERKVNELAVI